MAGVEVAAAGPVLDSASQAHLVGAWPVVASSVAVGGVALVVAAEGAARDVVEQCCTPGPVSVGGEGVVAD